MDKKTIVVAGATGALGQKIVRDLVKRGAEVRALVRPSSKREASAALQAQGADVRAINTNDVDAVANASQGASCVVSALAGLEDVIIGAQTVLLDAAIKAGVPRFIPSDFAIDFYKVADGTNRNLDLRRRFAAKLDAAPIKATSILCGLFSEFLFSDAPYLTFSIKRAIYYGKASQAFDITAMDDVADYTAAAALDDDTPRFLRIAGNVVTPNDLAAEATEAYGDTYKTLWAGPVGALPVFIAMAKLFDRDKGALYPAWQGMQYMHNMCSGAAKLDPLDNGRYADVIWTPVRETLKAGKPDFID